MFWLTDTSIATRQSNGEHLADFAAIVATEDDIVSSTRAIRCEETLTYPMNVPMTPPE